MDREGAALTRQPTTLPSVRATAINMCYIVFTSGSTGRPKGTVLQHNSVINYLLGMVRSSLFTKGWLCWLRSA